MQPIVKAAMLCDYALTADDGKLSVMGLFGNINFPTLPNAYPRFFVVIVASFGPGDHAIQLGILDPTGQQVLPEQPTVSVHVDGPGADTNLVVDFNNLPFTRAGIHQVQLYFEGRLLHSIPLNVQSAAVNGITARPN
ncbi:MAG: DUF6941 family protein [Chloroflexota bacterium]